MDNKEREISFDDGTDDNLEKAIKFINIIW
jgi:hypothetical protein